MNVFNIQSSSFLSLFSTKDPSHSKVKLVNDSIRKAVFPVFGCSASFSSPTLVLLVTGVLLFFLATLRKIFNSVLSIFSFDPDPSDRNRSPFVFPSLFYSERPILKMRPAHPAYPSSARPPFYSQRAVRKEGPISYPSGSRPFNAPPAHPAYPSGARPPFDSQRAVRKEGPISYPNAAQPSGGDITQEQKLRRPRKKP